MWWTARKGSWPPHKAEEGEHDRAHPPSQAGRFRGAPPSAHALGYYVECHANWHDAAMPDHARRALRLR
jgi:hypothetical protein